MQSARWLAGLCLLAGGLLPHPPSAVAAEKSALARIREDGFITIALDPDNLPYSHSKNTPSGFDVEVSKALAKKLGVEPRFLWVDTIHDSPLGELLEEKCDCFVGAAIEVNTADEGGNVGEKVLFTKPYFSTGYMLVVNPGGPRAKQLSDIKGKRIGAEAGSVADYDLNLKGYTRRLYPTQEAIYDGLRGGEVDAGFMWAPNVAWMLKMNPKLRFKFAEGYKPEKDFRWNFAVAVRKEDKDLKEFLDKAVQEMVKDGQVRKIFAKYGVPWFAPFE